MPFVVELYFDTVAEECIRGAWEAIDEAGISSYMLNRGFRPHVSLGVCNYLESDALDQELSTFAASIAPFPLSLSSVGTFLTSEGVIFLGVTVTEQLLNIHAAFHKFFRKHAQEQREYYAVGKWIPHCTIAFGLSECQIGEAVAVCRQISIPIFAEVTQIGYD